MEKLSSFKTINNTRIDKNTFHHWKKKFLRTIDQAYRKAPYFDQVVLIIKDVLNQKETRISHFSAFSVMLISQYLGLKTDFQFSSDNYSETKGLEKAERLIHICKKVNAETYLNPYGGRELYSKEYFAERGVKLYFLKPKTIIYNQFSDVFVPNLSIIDVMMFNSSEKIKKILNRYELI